MSRIIYNPKFYRNFFVRQYIRVTRKLVERYDSAMDKKICGVSLVKYVPSLYRESKGATGSQSTSYWYLDQILKNAEFTPEDHLFDVGCGKGRVLAYLIGKKYPCKISGVELNKDVAAFGQSWISRYENAEMIQGSAFDLDFNNYTVLFMGRPFEQPMFEEFIIKLEKELKHPIRLYSWYDQRNKFLDDRSGWELVERDTGFRSHGLFMFPNPQRYSVWKYVPNEE